VEAFLASLKSIFEEDNVEGPGSPSSSKVRARNVPPLRSWRKRSSFGAPTDQAYI